jgi:hypothetical protein
MVPAHVRSQETILPTADDWRRALRVSFVRGTESTSSAVPQSVLPSGARAKTTPMEIGGGDER